ncbi:hypothetical protein OG937_24385 [Streptomyces sp. NBC_00510]
MTKINVRTSFPESYETKGVNDLVQIRIADAARRIEAARKRRARFAEARRHGVAARHRAKLARQEASRG